jgi:hypothetical protein
MEGLYCLEAQEFIQTPLEKKGFYHIGYMDKVFTSKLAAISYYDDYNEHMRSINLFANSCNDCDPKTNLRYVIRRYFGENCSIKPFKEQ